GGGARWHPAVAERAGRRGAGWWARSQQCVAGPPLGWRGGATDTRAVYRRNYPASTSAASFASDDRQPASLSAAGTPGGSPSCTATRSVPPSASTSAIVIVISPCSAGSVVSNSTTSTTCSFFHSFTTTPW